MLDLRKAAGFTDYFLICSGTNPRQMRAIADAVIESLAADGAKPAHVEGYDRSEWILLDYFDFIVHVFAPETRMFYGLERLWGNAERMRGRRACRADARLVDCGCCVDASSAPSCAGVRRAARSCRRAGPVCDALLGARSVLFTPPLCERCGDPLPAWRPSASDSPLCARCRRGRRAVDRARAVGAYEGALRAIVHALKYDGRRSLARAARRC